MFETSRKSAAAGTVKLPGLSEKDPSFLGTTFAPLTTDMVVEEMMRMVHDGRRGSVATVNVAILIMMRQDLDLKRYVDNSALVVADGQPIVWGSRIIGTHLPGRVTGVDLVEDLCARCASTGFSVFLLGGTSEVVTDTRTRLQRSNPGLRIASMDGYFDSAEAPSRAEAIREFGTDVLIVGMGVPRQERFIMDHWDRLGVPVAIGVGGSFNVLSGTLRRAPTWMQRSGLEWAYRLHQEPRRLFKRYAVTNSQFCALLAREIVRRKRMRQKSPATT